MWQLPEVGFAWKTKESVAVWCFVLFDWRWGAVWVRDSSQVRRRGWAGLGLHVDLNKKHSGQCEVLWLESLADRLVPGFLLELAECALHVAFRGIEGLEVTEKTVHFFPVVPDRLGSGDWETTLVGGRQRDSRKFTRKPCWTWNLLGKYSFFLKSMCFGGQRVIWR